jgi:hypothetical protein
MFADPPVTTAQIFALDYSAPRSVQPPHLGDDLHLAAGLSEYDLVLHTNLGRWGMAMFSARERGLTRWDQEPWGAGWRADDFYVYQNASSGKIGFLWAIAWDVVDSADRGALLAEFVDARVMSVGVAWRVVHDGPYAVFVGTEESTELDAWAATATAALSAIELL